MKATRDFLKKLGLPSSDGYSLPSTSKRFPDGAQYRFEIPSVEGPRCLQAVIESAADEMAVGLGRASAFLKTRSADLGLGRVYLSGGGARIPGLAEALGRILSVETHVANPFERIPVRPDACVDVELEEVAPMLLLPVGLALRPMPRGRDR